MIIKITGNGSSFRGAGAYYLHDKPFKTEAGERVNPMSADRVEWAEVRNCVAADAPSALDEMWHTAEDQQLIKAQAGVARSGNRCVDPVKSLSLSWQPSQTPTQEQMIDAADSYLEHMGWREHQAVMIAHNDTAHPHVHLIINRVHPVTGRTLDDFRERVRSQVWGLAYEREHGQILCQQRLDRDYAADRIAKRDDTIPQMIEKAGRAQEAPFIASTEELAGLDGTERDLLHTRQREEREAFFGTAPDQFRAVRQAAFVDVRREHRAQWKEHYASAKMLRSQARELARENAERAIELASSGRYGEAWKALAGADPSSVDQATIDQTASFNPIEIAERSIADSRSKIGEAQKCARIERQQVACEQLFNLRADQFAEMKERQRDERVELRGMIAAAERGQPVDLVRANFLMFGNRPMPTDAAQLLREARTANENAAPIDNREASNDNRPPKFRADAQRVTAAADHIDRLLASARMTGSGSMVAMQMADMQMLQRRTARATDERKKRATAAQPDPRKETTDRVFARNDRDERTDAEKARDAQRDIEREQRTARDRGGGRDR